MVMTTVIYKSWCLISVQECVSYSWSTAIEMTFSSLETQPLPLPLIAELKKGAELYKTPRLASLCSQALGNVQIDDSYDEVLPSTLSGRF